MQGDQFQPSFYFFKNSLVLYLKTITYPKIAFCQFNVLDSQKNLLRALYGLLAFKRRYNESVTNESSVLSFIYLHHLVLFISTILFISTPRERDTRPEIMSDNEQDKFKFACSNCKRLMHYKCNELPAYQIKSLLDIKKKKKQGNKDKSGNC